MSRKASSFQPNKTPTINKQLQGLNDFQISRIKGLSILDQAEKVKDIKTQLINDNMERLKLISNYTNMIELLRSEPTESNSKEIKRYTMLIRNLKKQEPKYTKNIDKLHENLTERLNILDELKKSRVGREVMLLPPAPKGRGKKRGTQKRKKPKKRKTRIKK
tara:strand:- start:629 stop:1114 length:486 start_codon:yes stop_codon:yes gene_type:complete